MEPNYLIHYGMPRRSGRYKWGSGNRPYQSGGGPVRRVVKTIKNKRIEKKVQKGLEKARRIAAENRKLEADKPRVLRSGSAGEVMRYKGRLTNQELSEAVKRLELEAKLSDMAKKEINTTMKKIDGYMKQLDTVTNWTKTGIKAWNQIADVYNSTADGRRHPLTRIETQPQQRRREDEERRSS